MIVAGFVLSAVVSLASFIAILTFASPQASPTIIGLFFLSLFAIISSIAILGHMLIFRLKGWKIQEHKELLPIILRRGIFLGGLATLLFIFDSMRLLTVITAAGLLIFFVGIEAYMTYRENRAANQHESRTKFM